MPQGNKIEIDCYLGKKPELEYTPSGTPVLRWGAAETRRYKNKKNEDVEHTNWHSLAFWGESATYAFDHYQKGDNLNIKGRFDSRKFTPKDGSERTVWEVTVFFHAKWHRDAKAKSEESPDLNSPESLQAPPPTDQAIPDAAQPAWPI